MTKLQEFQRGWPVLLTAFVGVGCGISALAIYNLGLFANDMQKEIGLSRGQFGTGILIMTIFLSLTTPVAGWVIDRYGPKWPCIFGAASLSICFLGMTTFLSSVSAYLVAMALMGGLASASAPIGYTRAVASWFNRARGLAFGITVTGTGVSSIIVPLVVSHFIQGYGWRSGFISLAVIAAACIPFTFLFLRITPSETSITVPTHESRAEFIEVRRSRLFWLLLVTLSTMSVGFLGLIIQFVPLMRDMGLSAPEAARYASLMGVSIVAGRIIVGWLADEFHAPWIGAGVCLLGGLACLALLTGIPELLPLVALMLGLVVGAEIDLISFLTARYFKVTVYGRVYSWQYACFGLAGGASSAWIGALRDHFGSNRPALIVIAGLSVVMIGLFVALPRYPRAGVVARQSEAANALVEKA
jgi:MFS family permease